MELSSEGTGFPSRSKRTVGGVEVEDGLSADLVDWIHSSEGSNAGALGKNLRRISWGVPSSSALSFRNEILDCESQSMTGGGPHE